MSTPGEVIPPWTKFTGDLLTIGDIIWEGGVGCSRGGGFVIPLVGDGIVWEGLIVVPDADRRA